MRNRPRYIACPTGQGPQAGARALAAPILVTSTPAGRGASPAGTHALPLPAVVACANCESLQLGVPIRKARESRSPLSPYLNLEVGIPSEIFDEAALLPKKGDFSENNWLCVRDRWVSFRIPPCPGPDHACGVVAILVPIHRPFFVIVQAPFWLSWVVPLARPPLRHLFSMMLFHLISCTNRLWMWLVVSVLLFLQLLALCLVLVAWMVVVLLNAFISITLVLAQKCPLLHSFTASTLARSLHRWAVVARRCSLALSAASELRVASVILVLCLTGSADVESSFPCECLTFWIARCS